MSHPTPPVPTDPAFQQQFGRSRGLLVGPTVVVAAIALWVGVVQLGGTTSPPTPRPEVSAPAAVASGGSSASAPASATLPPPLLQLFGPAPPGSVLIRDRALREVNLATGVLGEPIGESGYLDRMLALPGGGYVCVCVRQRTRGEERSNEVEIQIIRRDGARTATVNAGTWVGTDLPGLHQEPGPFSLDAAHSPDGRYVVLTTSLRRPPEWLREVVVVDVDTAAVTARIDLPVTPSASGTTAEPGATPTSPGPRWAWAPSPRFSPDGSKLLLSGVEVDERNGPVSHRSWVMALDAGRPDEIVELRSGEPADEDPCRDSFPEFAANDLIVTLCFGDMYAGPFLRRDRPDGAGMRRVSLRDALKDSAAPYLLTDGRGSVWLWDAWSTRAIRVDAVEGVVAATAAMPGRGTPERFLFPPAVLTPDGGRLIVAVAAGADDAGSVNVLDARTLDRVSEWNVDARLMTLGVSPDGKWLHLGHAPDWDDAGVAREPARIAVIDLETGTVRARLGQVGDGAFEIIDRHAAGT